MTKTDHRTRLGGAGPEVFPVALGCMGMAGMYGEATDAEGIATIQEAIERGVDLIDTGDFYGMGHNERPAVRVVRAVAALTNNRTHNMSRSLRMKLTSNNSKGYPSKQTLLSPIEQCPQPERLLFVNDRIRFLTR